MTDDEILETLHANLVCGANLEAALSLLLELSAFASDPWLRDCLLRHKPCGLDASLDLLRSGGSSLYSGIGRQLSVANEVFESEIAQSDDVRAKISANETRPPRIAEFTAFLSELLRLPDDADVFLARRPNRVQRAAQGIEMGATQYNRKFRIVRGLHQELAKLHKAQTMQRRQASGLVGLVDGIELGDFKRDPVAASIVAVLAAGKAEIYSDAGVRPFDPVAPAIADTLNVLLDRCGAEANWPLIARVLPEARVFRKLSDSECGELLGHWVIALTAIARDMRELWRPELLASDTLIVGEGVDFYTWNLLSAAWNDARSAWLKFLNTAGLGIVTDELYPPKSLKVFSPGMRRAHVGAELDVWKVLPRPWECMDEAAPCNAALLGAACERFGLPPVLSGWLTASPIDASRDITPAFAGGYSRVAARDLSFGALKG